MSKLSKLLRDPRRFVQDAVLNAQASLAVARITPARDRGFRDRVQRHGGGDDVGETLRRALADTARVFITPDESGRDAYNCFAHELDWVLHFARLIAEQRGVAVRVLRAGHETELNRANVMTTARRLRAATDFALVWGFDPGAEARLPLAVWERRGDAAQYYAKGHNAFVKRLPQSDFDRLYEPDTGRVDLRRLHRHPIDGVCDFDVDFVYTWVNHADPEWRRLIGEHRPLDSVDWDRYHAADELRYSLRSVHHFAPWARTIHVVTNCAEPPWLRPHPQIRWVTHEEVFPSGADYLPTFNSHAIESCLMRIEGLSEHFVYLNDDVFLGGPASPLDFFAANGTSVSYLEPYGMVLGTPDPEKPDYLNAALNGKRLIEETFGVSPTRLHEHVPYALKRSVLSEIEGRFAADFDRVRRARFRTMDDISVVSFLYHQYAFQTRHALRAPAANAILIRPANSASAFVELLSGRRRQFFCINDGGDSAADASYAARSTRFLARFFPEPAPWEASSSS